MTLYALSGVLVVFGSFTDLTSNFIRAGSSHLGGFINYRPRPVCVALLTEHHVEIVCGNKFIA